jgi:PAS domain S-box-containing protein
MMEMLGYPDRDALLARNAADLYADPDERAVHVQDWLQRDRVLGFETRFRRLDGTTFWGRINAAVVRDPEGQPQYLDGVIEDVDSHKAAEQRFRRAFACSATGMALAIPGGNFLEANRTFQKLVGYSSDDLSTMTWEDLTFPEDRDWSRILVETVLAGQSDSIDIEKRYLRHDGSMMWGRVSAALTRDSDGNPREAIVQLNDVTAAHELRQRLDADMRTKDAFLASASHELRTPLAAVLGFANLLGSSDMALSNEEREFATEAIAREAGKMAVLIENMLVASRAELGTLYLASVEVDLRAQVAQVVETLDADERQAVEIRGSSSVRAIGDPLRTRLIVQNLIVNALQHGQPPIIIDIGEPGVEQVTLAVSDSGPGIPEVVRMSAFDRFSSSLPLGTQPAQLGLGLWVSKRLAVLMGGDLSYRYAGDSSVFELTLPALPAG